MIGGVVTEERELLTRAKRKERGCVGSPRMMVGTFRISRPADDDESTCSGTRSSKLNSAVGVDDGLYRRGGTEVQSPEGGCSILKSSRSRRLHATANSLWNSYRIGDLTVDDPSTHSLA